MTPVLLLQLGECLASHMILIIFVCVCVCVCK